MKVAVVGMGAAGIRTAMLLEAAGVDVRLFEARDRVGGRLYTVRGPGGVAYDAGGEWVDADHCRTLALAREHGFEAEATPRWPGVVCYRGEMCPEDNLWADALEDELRLEAAAQEICRNLHATPWENEQYAALDDVTLADFIRENSSSERGRWWLGAKYRSDEGDDPDRIGLLGWLLGYRNYLGRDDDAASAFRLADGMGRLFESLAASLRTPILMEKVLRRVVHDDRRVILQFDDGETTVDRVVLCMPPPALERVVFDPALPSAKRCAIEACEMSRAIKIALEFDEPWWHQEEWSGSLLCDMPVQQTWDGTKGGRAVLNCYVCGRDSLHFTQNGQPVACAVRQLADLFPAAQERFARGVMYDWVSDTFALGAFSHMPPGYVMNHLAHIARPCGRIHFAGEHAATWYGFIEGALESAERATAEVLDA